MHQYSLLTEITLTPCIDPKFNLKVSALPTVMLGSRGRCC